MHHHSPVRLRPFARTSRLALALAGCLCAGQLLASPAIAGPATAAPAAVAPVSVVPASVATSATTVLTPTATLTVNNPRPNDGALVVFTGRVVRDGVGLNGSYAYLQIHTAKGWRTLSGARLYRGVAKWRRTHTGTHAYRVFYPARYSNGTLVSRAAASRYRAVVARATAANRVIAEARRHVGRPYVFGASGPRAFDCSGLTQYVYRRAAGKRLPHLANSQQRYGRAIPKSQARPGDLLVFRRGSHGYHVGIYAGGGYMYDAPRPGVRVGKHKIWSRSYVVRRIV